MTWSPTNYTATGIPGFNGGYAYLPGSGVTQFLDSINGTMAMVSTSIPEAQALLAQQQQRQFEEQAEAAVRQEELKRQQDQFLSSVMTGEMPEDFAQNFMQGALAGSGSGGGNMMEMMMMVLMMKVLGVDTGNIFGGSAAD